jgi:hypothetical protein
MKVSAETMGALLAKTKVKEALDAPRAEAHVRSSFRHQNQDRAPSPKTESRTSVPPADSRNPLPSACSRENENVKRGPRTVASQRPSPRESASVLRVGSWVGSWTLEVRFGALILAGVGVLSWKL